MSGWRLFAGGCVDRAGTAFPIDKFYSWGMIRLLIPQHALLMLLWDFLWSQRSVGYVHFSQFIVKRCGKEMRAIQGEGCEIYQQGNVNFKVGRRERNWSGNWRGYSCIRRLY